jgi:hypothetical protein
MTRGRFMRYATLVSIGLILGGILGVVASRMVRRHRQTRGKPPNPAMIINGETVPMEEFITELKVLSGQQVLQHVLEQRLVLQEAKRQGIGADEASIARQMKALSPQLDPMVRQSMEREMRYRDVFRKLLLAKVSESEKRLVYDLFREELANYELFGIFLANRADGQAVMSGLEFNAGFAALAARYSVHSTRAKGGAFGYMTMPQIRLWLGEDAVGQVAALQSGKHTGPFYTNQGLMVLKLGAVHKSYQSIKPAVEELIANAGKVALLNRLLQEGKVRSLYLQGIEPEPEATGTPGAGSVPLDYIR